MSASAVLEDVLLAVEPGEQVTTEVRVKNTGTIVEEFTISVVGEAEPWAVVEPATVSLLPEASTTVTVTFTPPRDFGVVAGPRPVAVMIEPRENPEGVVVEELQLDVGAFSTLDGDLVPRTVRARRWARTRLAIDNRGNSATAVHLRASDPDDALRFELRPATLTVAPGGASFATLRVRAKDRPFTGQPRTLSFVVKGEPDVGPVLHLDGAVQVMPVVPRWAPRAAIAAVLAMLALFALWFALVKPTLESTAREAVSRDVAAAEEAAAIADEAAGSAGAAAVGAEVAALDAGAAAEQVAGEEALAEEAAVAAAEAAGELGSLAGQRPPIAGDPFGFRLQILNPPGSTQSTSYEVDFGQVLSLTDVVLQNPHGDRGLLRVGRAGFVLLETRLENFRDLDYHFLAPIVYTSAADVRLTVVCENDPGVDCSAAAYFAGYLATIPPASEEPVGG